MQNVPCQVQPELWFSDNASDKAYAKTECFFCPLQAECLELGQDEEYGIFGGIDEKGRAVDRKARLQAETQRINDLIIELKDREGMNFSQIAREVEMPRTTVALRYNTHSPLASVTENL